ncbi:MAG TPA: hypothetical protein PK639_01775 [Candidatus Woesebacteria bacterium]|nr:hypothetical protein [Candidatus Woesebacteria bacterium]
MTIEASIGKFDDHNLVNLETKIIKDGIYSGDFFDTDTDIIKSVDVGSRSSVIEVAGKSEIHCSAQKKPTHTGRTDTIVIDEGELLQVVDGILVYSFTQLKDPNKTEDLNNKNWFRRQGLRY